MKIFYSLTLVFALSVTISLLSLANITDAKADNPPYPIFTNPIEIHPSRPLHRFFMVDPYQDVLNQFDNYDFDGDGTKEINSLNFLPFESEEGVSAKGSKFLLVLVESRLLSDLSGLPHAANTTLAKLKRFKQDLKLDNYTTRFISADIYGGSKHQDGATVLALRRFLIKTKEFYSNFQGVVLIGSFPETTLVRRWIWNKTNETINIKGNEYKNKNFVRIIPELIDTRAEIVLSDLDGNWESTYKKAAMNVEGVVAIPDAGTSWPPATTATIKSSIYEVTNYNYQDFFFIQDDNYTKSISASKLQLNIDNRMRNLETASSDRSLANPLSRPDIIVSRINPIHIAVNPDLNYRDSDGKSLIASDGKPQTVRASAAINTGLNFRDQKLERRLIWDFLDRNHNFRRGGDTGLAFRTAAITAKDSGLLNPTTFNNDLRKSSSSFTTSVAYPEASLVDYVKMVKNPAVLIGIAAHSNPWNSGYGSNYTLNTLTSDVGSKPWRWERVGNTFNYEPSLKNQNGAADLYVHRTMWENKVLSSAGEHMYVHMGCEANGAAGADSEPYNSNNYAGFQNAEGILFYLNGLNIITRAKTFYDKPEGFSEALGKTTRSRFGDGWRAYFDHDSRLADLNRDQASNKKVYNWSVLGDWTLRLNYDNGLGFFNGQYNRLNNIANHPNETWAGGWNFVSADNSVVGSGDFNGDGKSEILVKSNWGIGLLSLNSEGVLTSIVAKPRDTWFGEWRYDATINSGRDQIKEIADFDGDGRDEILITSSWGIGILKLQGNTFVSIMAKPKDTWFGEWRYNASVNSGLDKIEGVGNFDGSDRKQILISSSWGIGILKYVGGTLTSMVAKPKDTWFGEWRYNASVNSGHDRIEAIANFIGGTSKKDQILIASSWGIGILSLDSTGKNLNTILAKTTDTWFGGWRYNSNATSGDKIAGAVDMNGDGAAEVVITSNWGIGLLDYDEHARTFNSLVSKPNDTWFGAWRYNASVNTGKDRILGFGKFENNNKKDILVASSWGQGILKLNGNSFTTVSANPHGSKIGLWWLNTNDRLVTVGKFSSAAGEGEEFILKR
ncbi:MAG: VCBS repeat-containing protein [Oligoflexia bacterium]|nr:VCBS repeat-containing protein [Oligoflexia bacterium]